MMFATCKIFGRYFSIDDEAVNRLIDHFYGHLPAMDRERNRAYQSALEWKRNWQSRILLALREHVIAAVETTPLLLKWGPEAAQAHFHKSYDIEVMASNILNSILQVIDVKAIHDDHPLAVLYVTFYMSMCWYILSDIRTHLAKDDEQRKSKAWTCKLSDEVYDSFKFIAKHAAFEHIKVSDVPIHLPKLCGGGHNRKKRALVPIEVLRPNFQIFYPPGCEPHPSASGASTAPTSVLHLSAANLAARDREYNHTAEDEDDDDEDEGVLPTRSHRRNEKARDQINETSSSVTDSLDDEDTQENVLDHKTTRYSEDSSMIPDNDLFNASV